MSLTFRSIAGLRGYDWDSLRSKEIRATGDTTVPVKFRPIGPISRAEIEQLFGWIQPLPKRGALDRLLKEGDGPAERKTLELRILPGDREELEVRASDLGFSIEDTNFDLEKERLARQKRAERKRGDRRLRTRRSGFTRTYELGH